MVVGELARELGLRVPELVLAHFDPAIAADEPHQEVRDLLNASAGLNLGMDYLSGGADFTPEVAEVFPVDAAEAGRVVWLDALTVNVDRTVHSSNLMVWPTFGTAPPRLWLIDHGAAPRLPPPLGRLRAGQGVRLPATTPSATTHRTSAPPTPNWRRR